MKYSNIRVIFFLNVALTALSLVIEQNDGTQERVWITGMYICMTTRLFFYFSSEGVKSNEIILSQLIVHSMILLIQIVIVLFTSLYIFQVKIDFHSTQAKLSSGRFHYEVVYCVHFSSV
jgi:hypothetical protein